MFSHTCGAKVVSTSHHAERVCRVSESLRYSTAWSCIHFLAPYPPCKAQMSSTSRLVERVCRVSESLQYFTAW